MPTDVSETSVIAQAFHLWIAFTGLHRENQELQAVLAARPELPDPALVYVAQVVAKQGQATDMQEALHFMAREAHELLKGLQE